MASSWWSALSSSGCRANSVATARCHQSADGDVDRSNSIHDCRRGSCPRCTSGSAAARASLSPLPSSRTDPRGVAGFFYHSRMLGVVHLVTLGWMATSILGAL